MKSYLFLQDVEDLTGGLRKPVLILSGQMNLIKQYMRPTDIIIQIQY